MKQRGTTRALRETMRTMKYTTGAPRKSAKLRTTHFLMRGVVEKFVILFFAFLVLILSHNVYIIVYITFANNTVYSAQYLSMEPGSSITLGHNYPSYITLRQGYVMVHAGFPFFLRKRILANFQLCHHMQFSLNNTSCEMAC